MDDCKGGYCCLCVEGDTRLKWTYLPNTDVLVRRFDAEIYGEEDGSDEPLDAIAAGGNEGEGDAVVIYDLRGYLTGMRWGHVE